jgi:toxin FitB
VSRVVLDTDVSSELFKGTLTGPLRARLADRSWCITFITVGELWRWAAMRSWGFRRQVQLDEFLAGLVMLPSTEPVSRTWGRITAAATRRGRPRPANDSWIAASCLAYDLPLATHNVKDHWDFADREGLTLL